jgi:hypothetical protein
VYAVLSEICYHYDSKEEKEEKDRHNHIEEKEVKRKIIKFLIRRGTNLGHGEASAADEASATDEESRKQLFEYMCRNFELVVYLLREEILHKKCIPEMFVQALTLYHFNQSPNSEKLIAFFLYTRHEWWSRLSLHQQIGNKRVTLDIVQTKAIFIYIMKHSRYDLFDSLFTSENINNYIQFRSLKTEQRPIDILLDLDYYNYHQVGGYFLLFQKMIKLGAKLHPHHRNLRGELRDYLATYTIYYSEYQFWRQDKMVVKNLSETDNLFQVLDYDDPADFAKILEVCSIVSASNRASREDLLLERQKFYTCKYEPMLKKYKEELKKCLTNFVPVSNVADIIIRFSN